MTRDQILDAATSLLATRGTEHATVRKVAAEAGLSPGAVQHHFKTRDELIAAAYGRTAERFRADLEDAVDGIDDPFARFRAGCHLLAGCADDSERAREATAAWLAFAGIAATGGPAAPGYREAWQGVEDDLAAGLGDREEAALLLALLDGIAVARLTEPERMTARRGRDLIDRHLARLTRDRDDDAEGR